jgi:SP family general alpha glucoside:H+ symporter-like MFS transporter
VNGYLVEMMGHIRILRIALVFLTAFIFLTFFSTSIEMLFVGEILCGLPWGLLNTIAPSYAVEIAQPIFEVFW